MQLKKLLGVKSIFSYANIIFAGFNAVSSIFLLKIFGVNLFGLFAYYSNYDNFLDYLGSHIRATFEASVPSSSDVRRVIESFAIIQFFFGLVSMFLFFLLSLLLDDRNAVRICQIFVLLSPGKSYIAFFRVFSKISGDLHHYSLAILGVSLINVVVLALAYYGLSFFAYFWLRAFTLIFTVTLLIYYSGFGQRFGVGSFRFGLSELYKSSRVLLVYSFSTLLYLVCDKLLIGNLIGVSDLGFYVMSFIFYSFVQIISSSRLSSYFNNLMKGDHRVYRIILCKSFLFIITFVIFSEFILTLLLRIPFFRVYLNSVTYLFWLIPSSIPIIFLEIGYLYMISKGLLKKVNFWFIFVSIIYLALALFSSLVSKNIIWFSVFFFFHQFALVFILMYRLEFLRHVYRNVFYTVKRPLLVLIGVHAIFILLNS